MNKKGSSYKVECEVDRTKRKTDNNETAQTVRMFDFSWSYVHLCFIGDTTRSFYADLIIDQRMLMTTDKCQWLINVNVFIIH